MSTVDDHAKLCAAVGLDGVISIRDARRLLGGDEAATSAALFDLLVSGAVVLRRPLSGPCVALVVIL